MAAGLGLIACTYGLVRLAYGLFLPDIQDSLSMSSAVAVSSRRGPRWRTASGRSADSSRSHRCAPPGAGRPPDGVGGIGRHGAGAGARCLHPVGDPRLHRCRARVPGPGRHGRAQHRRVGQGQGPGSRELRHRSRPRGRRAAGSAAVPAVADRLRDRCGSHRRRGDRRPAPRPPDRGQDLDRPVTSACPRDSLVVVTVGARAGATGDGSDPARRCLSRRVDVRPHPAGGGGGRSHGVHARLDRRWAWEVPRRSSVRGP